MKKSFLLTIILIIFSNLFIVWNFINSNTEFIDIFYLLLFQGFFVMLFSIFKIFLLKKEELDQPTNEFKNTHLSWALQVICPLNITLIGNIFAFAFGLILIISIGLNLIQRGQLNSNIINLNFILPMILVLITIEIIYLIIFLFLTNRSSKKIVSAANKFTAPLALLIILSFFMIDLKMSSILTIPILASLLFIFKFIVDIYYSFNLFN